MKSPIDHYLPVDACFFTMIDCGLMNQQNTLKPLPVMIGTAGHVDHGKTSLVRLLTGFDTDRLREEKERGLSIDLGVAPLQISERYLAGIIDLPGHTDFIRNMVAGAASIDILILVIAADDGVMPQTREHLHIVRSLNAPAVMAVLTKTDIVSERNLEIVRTQASDFLKDSGFADAPIVAVSNETGEGIDEVRKILERLALSVKKHPDERAFRMHVRSRFVMKGQGTVLTGIPVSGRVQVGESLEILPAGKRTVLRAVQNYRQSESFASGGVSTGLNLRDIEPDELCRGMSVTIPGMYTPVSEITAFFRNSSEDITLKKTATLKLHTGTAAKQASVRLIDRKDLHPGEGCFMNVRLKDPVVIAAGDRFLLRWMSPSASLGGGIVLSAGGRHARHKSPYLSELLSLAYEAVKKGDYLSAELLAGPAPVLQTQELFRLTQHLPQQAQKIVKEKEASHEIEHLGRGGWIVRARIREVVSLLKKHLRHYHENHAQSWGMEPVLVWNYLGLAPGNFDHLFSLLNSNGRNGDFALRHGRLSLKDFSPPDDSRMTRMRERILSRFKVKGLMWIEREDLLAGPGADMTGLKEILLRLKEEKTILAIGNYYVLPDFLDQCRENLFRLFEQKEELDIGGFRMATGLPRSAAISILELFDSEGLTMRAGDRRVLLKAPGKIPVFK